MSVEFQRSFSKQEFLAKNQHTVCATDIGPDSNSMTLGTWQVAYLNSYTGSPPLTRFSNNTVF